jgi:CDP-2,3-bis-(O-geranylgeranyl)-sn-glycerol synthase
MESLVNRIVALATPCYVANATPVVVAKVVKRTHPIDGGSCFLDGRRILGDGKSIEGFVSGIMSGTAIGFALKQGGLLSVQEAFVLSLGTMLGDTLGSFVKRRLGIERGDPAPLLDQLTFLLVALLLYQLVYGWLDALTVVILVIVTPPIHLVTNYLAYKIGLKSKPW